MFEIVSVMVMLFLGRGGGGRGGGGVTFFLEIIQFFGEGYILKLAFSHDEVLSCIFQNALNCSQK